MHSHLTPNPERLFLYYFLDYVVAVEDVDAFGQVAKVDDGGVASGFLCLYEAATGVVYLY